MKAERTYREAVYALTDADPLPASGNGTRTLQPDKLIIEALEGQPLHVKVMGRLIVKGGLSRQRGSIIYGRFSDCPLRAAPRWVRDAVQQSGLVRRVDR